MKQVKGDASLSYLRRHAGVYRHMGTYRFPLDPCTSHAAYFLNRGNADLWDNFMNYLHVPMSQQAHLICRNAQEIAMGFNGNPLPCSCYIDLLM